MNATSNSPSNPSLTKFISDDAIGIAIFGALVIHAILILGVSFDIQHENPPQPELTLDVTLIPTNQKQEKAEKPQFLAQKNNEGGGKEEIKKRDTSPKGSPNAINAETPMPKQQKAAAPKPEVSTKQKNITTKKTKVTVAAVTDKRPSPVKKPLSIAQILANTQIEIDQLTAELDKRAQFASTKSRRKAISASTQEFKYAAYMEAWRKKVERIGNLNYPDAARRDKLFGSLIMHVAIRSDGSIEKIRIVRSSGHRVLDDSAKLIVRLAAPYAAFPPEIREQVDILDITRTWQYQNKSKNAFSTH